MASATRALRRMCVLAAAVASVAGCMGMPSNGPTEQFGASPQSSAPDGNLVGVVPSGPQPGENPSQIVQGFLTASASYPTYNVAQEYLVSSAVKTWNPGFAVTVFSQLTVPKWVVTSKPGRTGGPQASVDVSGPVQASFNGSGQYLSAQSQDQSHGPWNFKLVKVDGQWRITNPPGYRMLPSSAFALFYKPQDLYFFGTPQDQVLVPDSVFVPLGATVTQLLSNLVAALTEGPRTPWLVGATETQLPPGTRVQQPVTTDGPTVTVNLVGDVAKASTKQLELFTAQLVWTLTGPPNIAPAIQSVVLELNGRPWAPRSAPCPGGRIPRLQQTQAGYRCFDPYPSSATSFYYINRGQTWARCGSESRAQQGLIGSVMPVVGRTGVVTSQRCELGRYVHEAYPALPSAQPQSSLPPASRVAVSPDGRYLAIVSAPKGDLYIEAMPGQAASFRDRPRLTGGGITSLSWDRDDNLWVAQNGGVVTLSATGKGAVPVAFDGSITNLSVAPDGVRIAFTAQVPGANPGIYLAAIGGGTQVSGQLSSAGTHPSIRTFATLGPNVDDPASLAWYSADNLIVLNAAATGNTLWEVPVDGQQAQQQVAPADVTSITADGAANVLVAGLAGGNLAVSTSLEGPWYQLGEPGQHPVYPG